MNSIQRLWTTWLILAFVGTNVPCAKAGEVTVPLMPKPGTMVQLSVPFIPSHLQGLTIHPENALKFDFLVHKGDGNLTLVQKKEEYTKLVKYFLAALTVPEKNQWVNLSPYEHNRIIEDNFGKTEMGRDLLTQDYLLKQITSSLMYPESGLGKEFWDKVYAEVYKKYGNTSASSRNIPVNTFNKIWITPDEAVVYESGSTAYILKSHLKVMLEEDYLSLSNNVGTRHAWSVKNDSNVVASKVIREIILPALEHEVNEGKNFALLRQIYSGMVLATWYKKSLKESLLGKVYVDKSKVRGVDQNPKNNEEIYQEYLAAFKKGVYNYIKEEEDAQTHQTIPRKYFSGGFAPNDQAMSIVFTGSPPLEYSEKVMVSLRAMGQKGQLDLRMKLHLMRTSESYAWRKRTQRASEEPRDFHLGRKLWYERVRIVGRTMRGQLKQELADYLEISPEQLDKYEEGTIVPSVNEFLKMMEFLNVADQFDGRLEEEFLFAYVKAENDQGSEAKDTEIKTSEDRKRPFIRSGFGSRLANRLAYLKKDSLSLSKQIRKTKNVSISIQRINSFIEGEDMPTRREYDILKDVLKVNGHDRELLKAMDAAYDKGILMKKNLEDAAMAPAVKGGIDLNSANMAMIIKRDGKGVPLSFALQDMVQLNRIEGFEPVILEIAPAVNPPILSELETKGRGRS